MLMNKNKVPGKKTITGKDEEKWGQQKYSSASMCAWGSLVAGVHPDATGWDGNLQFLFQGYAHDYPQVILIMS